MNSLNARHSPDRTSDACLAFHPKPEWSSVLSTAFQKAWSALWLQHKTSSRRWWYVMITRACRASVHATFTHTHTHKPQWPYPDYNRQTSHMHTSSVRCTSRLKYVCVCVCVWGLTQLTGNVLSGYKTIFFQ